VIPHYLRRLHAGDESFVYNAVLRGQRSATPLELSSKSLFTPFQNNRTARALQAADVAFVASPLGDEQTILGFVLASRGLHALHYVYVKHLFRKQALGLELLNAAYAAIYAGPLVFYTHHTHAGMLLCASWRALHPGVSLVYNPEVL
jgi:hypothetical protein